MKLIYYSIIFVVAVVFAACGSSKKALEAQNQMLMQQMMMQNQQQSNLAQQNSSPYGNYSRADELDEKLNTLTKDGWQVDGSSRTLRGELMEHYSKVDANPKLEEMSGTSENCKLIVVARSSAINSASMEYANKMSQEIVGRALRNMGKDESSAEAKEYDEFRQACSTKFAQSIKGDMVESYSLKCPKKDGTTSYQVMFLVDKDDISRKRNDAMKAAIEETKLRNDQAKLIMDFINEE